MTELRELEKAYHFFFVFSKNGKIETDLDHINPHNFSRQAQIRHPSWLNAQGSMYCWLRVKPESASSFALKLNT